MGSLKFKVLKNWKLVVCDGEIRIKIRLKNRYFDLEYEYFDLRIYENKSFYWFGGIFLVCL